MNKKIELDVRRIIIDELLSKGNVKDNPDYRSFVERIYPESKTLPALHDRGQKNLSGEIWKHMDLNSDISLSDMFYKYINIENISDEQFLSLLEQYVNPNNIRCVFDEGIDGGKKLQETCVEIINDSLDRSGHYLTKDHSTRNNDFYKIVSKSLGVNEDIKNIIFAVTGKPDIVIDDALANSIKVKNKECCLIYNRPIRDEPLTWNQMVEWYDTHIYSVTNAEEAYINRLKKSIGKKSPPEKILFESYLEWLREVGGDVPALIPQVHLYYDPLKKEYRGGSSEFERQIFDFFMIFSLRYRVVIEIDGKIHYSDENNLNGYDYPVYIANADKYAKMVSAQRDLSLYGYDVYRFGGKELEEDEKSKNMVKDFFNRLLKKYQGCF